MATTKCEPRPFKESASRSGEPPASKSRIVLRFTGWFGFTNSTSTPFPVNALKRHKLTTGSGPRDKKPSQIWFP